MQSSDGGSGGSLPNLQTMAWEDVDQPLANDKPRTTRR